jgi:flotillin
MNQNGQTPNGTSPLDGLAPPAEAHKVPMDEK